VKWKFLTSLNKIYQKQITASSDSKKDLENNGLINSSLCQQKDDNKNNRYQTVLKKITKPHDQCRFRYWLAKFPVALGLNHQRRKRPNKGVLGQRFKVTISIKLMFV